KSNHAVLSGFFPIASQGIMVYRSQRDVRAVALRPLKVKDDETGAVSDIKPGEIVWKSLAMNRSLSVLLEKQTTSARVGPWLDSYAKVSGFDSFLYDNSLLGTLM